MRIIQAHQNSQFPAVSNGAIGRDTVQKFKWPMQRRYKRKLDGTVIDRVTGKIIGGLR
ncbi:MAG: hypothetical protein JSC189_001047 [Candidatus Tokpelaia sp. JSC189]|nr:MAG: hypothetical protein JSC189_001047 [Candidatus Tokpelaia sp. JSC189]